MSNYSIYKRIRIDVEGKIDLSKYSYVGKFCDDYAVVKEENLFKYINKNGEVLFDKEFYDAKDFKNGLAIVASDMIPLKYGIIDKAGNYVVKPIYDEIGDFKNGMAKVKLGHKYGYIGVDGEILINAEYTTLSDFFGDVAIVGDENGNNLIDKSGKKITNYKNAIIRDFNDNDLAVIIKKNILNDKFGLINKNGEMVFPLQRYALKNTVNNRTVMVNKLISTMPQYIHKFSVIDKNGVKYKLSNYHDVEVLNEDTLLTEYNGWYDLIDINSNKKSDFYEMIKKVNDNLYIVEKDGTYGLINSEGKVVLDVDYDKIYALDNYCIIKKKGLWGLADQYGRKITDNKYDIINIISNLEQPDMIEIKFEKDGKKGFVDINGVESHYFIKYNVNGEYYIAQKADNRYVLLDSNKNFVSDLPYDKIEMNDDMIIFDNYMAPIKNTKFNHLCVLNINNKEIVKPFVIAKKRDKYYNMLKKELDSSIKLYDKQVKEVSKDLEKIIFSDLEEKAKTNYKKFL